VRPDGATESPYASNQVGSKRPLEQEDEQLGVTPRARAHYTSAARLQHCEKIHVALVNTVVRVNADHILLHSGCNWKIQRTVMTT